MKKMILCIAAIAITGFVGLLPFNGTDVGKLHPVEVLAISAEAEMIVIETDTGLRGMGKTMEKTIENLKITSAGEIFLETANYVLVKKDCVYLLDGLFHLLRPACQIYVYQGDGKWDNVSEYLESHPSCVTLLNYRQGMKNIPQLSAYGEDYKIDRP